jgi:hypothetical protein
LRAHALHNLDPADDNPDEPVEEETSIDDPMQLNKLAASYNPASIGAMRSVVDPEAVQEGHFVIVRATADNTDNSSFTIGGHDVLLWLFKASGLPASLPCTS